MERYFMVGDRVRYRGTTPEQLAIVCLPEWDKNMLLVGSIHMIKKIQLFKWSAWPLPIETLTPVGVNLLLASQWFDLVDDEGQIIEPNPLGETV